MTIEEKIEAFKKEVGKRTLTDEQQRIYKAFTRLKGKAVAISVIDKTGKRISFKIYSDKRDCGTRHILERHYKTPTQDLTALEILNLCDIIRRGEPYKSKAYTVYKYVFNYGKVTLRATLRLSGNGLLKSFYSNRGMKGYKKKLSAISGSSCKQGALRKNGAGDIS